MLGAEYLLGLLPRGTHDFARFIRPSELDRWARRAGLELQNLAGLVLNPASGGFVLGQDVGRQLHRPFPPAVLMSSKPRVSAVLFDLDGTLLDTAPDMVATLNQVQAEESRQPLAYERARAFVSNGVLGLLKVAFGELPEPERSRLQQRYLQIYATRLAAATRVFPGMTAVLIDLERAGIPWGVVTNKPSFLTEPLLEQIGLRSRCACVVSGDTVPQRKPHPGQLFHALRCAQRGGRLCNLRGRCRARHHGRPGRRACARWPPCTGIFPREKIPRPGVPIIASKVPMNCLAFSARKRRHIDRP